MNRTKIIKCICAFLMIAGFSSYIYMCFINGPKHIYPAPSGQAVYLGSEPACMINAEAERTIPELTKDFDYCIEIHKKYRAEAGH